MFLMLFSTIIAKPLQYSVQDNTQDENQNDDEKYEIQPEDINQLDLTLSDSLVVVPEIIANGNSELPISTERCQSSQDAVQKIKKTRDIESMNDNILVNKNYCAPSSGVQTRPPTGTTGSGGSSEGTESEDSSGGTSEHEQSSDNTQSQGVQKNNIVYYKKMKSCCYLIPKQIINGRINWGKCRKCTDNQFSFVAKQNSF